MADIITESDILSGTARHQRQLPPMGPETDDLADALKIVSDRTRLAILILLRRGELCVCDLVDQLKLPQNLVSHHLGVLRSRGLVQARRGSSDSRWVYYSINKPALKRLDELCQLLFDVATIYDAVAEC